MAYAVKYTFSHTDRLGMVNKIDISLEGYAGSIIELDYMGPSPIIISVIGNGEKFQSILGTEAKLTFIKDEIWEWAEFIDCKNKDYKVQHYLDTELNWTGYVMPGMYVEPLKAGRTYMEIRATDMLGDLHGIPYESATGVPYTGQESEIGIICNILSKIGMGLLIGSYVNIFNTDHAETASDDPLPQTYLNQENFRKDYITGGDCHEILKQIMLKYGARIIQSYGSWQIHRIHDLQESSVTFRIFTEAGVYVGNGTDTERTTTITDKTVSDANKVAWVEDALIAEVIPAWKHFFIKQTLGYRSNLLINSNFDKAFWEDSNNVSAWTKSAVGSWVYKSPDGVFMNTNATSIGAARSMTQTPITKHLVTTGSYTLAFKFEGRKTAGTLNAEIKIDDGTTPYYLTTGNTWSTTPSYKTIALGTGPTTYEFETAAIPVTDSDLTVTIFETVYATSAGVWWTNIECKLLTNTAYTPSEETYRTDIDADYNVVPQEIKLNLGDFPSGTIYCKEVVYWGCHVDSNGDALSTSWHHKGDTDHDTLINHMIADREANHDEPTLKISGTVYSKLLKFDNILIDNLNGANRYFMLTNAEWNLKEATWQGQWIEILTV